MIIKKKFLLFYTTKNEDNKGDRFGGWGISESLNPALLITGIVHVDNQRGITRVLAKFYAFFHYNSVILIIPSTIQIRTNPILFGTTPK